MNFDLFIQILTVLATVTLAISGVSKAARHELDFFGALVLALVCALGGGTLRDMMIGATPVFWLTDLSYLWIILLTTMVSIIVISHIPSGHNIRQRLMEVADAAGLALFAILGTQKALQYGIPAPAAVTMGVVTGIVGGMARDVLLQTTPLVMRGEIYALAAIAGAIVYVLAGLFVSEIPAIVAGMSVTFIIRLLAVFYGLRVPRLRFKD